MKTQILNKVYNTPITITDEQYVKVGADLDVYCLVSAKLRSIDTLSVSVMDIMDARDNDIPRSFLIETDASGDYTITGCSATEFGDSTGKPYAVYDATDYTFVGYYRLDPSNKIVHIADNSSIENSKQYLAIGSSDTPTALIPSMIKAQAMLKVVLGRTLTNVMGLVQTDGTANSVIDFQLYANQYTADLASVKVCTIPAKQYKRLQFPFHTSFAGTWYDAGEAVQITAARNTESLYMLVFFKDTYGNVSFPFIYVINP